MQCPVCGKDYEPKVYKRAKGGTAVGRPAKTCSRRCGAALRAGDPQERFWSHVDQSAGPEACWPWQGYRQPGPQYGVLGWEGHTWRAHRVAYVLANGSIHLDLDVLHRCDNPPCCNPAHLFQGTHDANMKDMASKGRSADKRGRSNGRAKISESDVREIRAAYGKGESQDAIGRRYGLSQSTVGRIVSRRYWRHVSD